jgi:MFS family permease
MGHRPVPASTRVAAPPGRLDRSPWRSTHTTIALALGFGWMLDAFEVSIINTLVGPIQATFGLSDRQVLWAYVAWFVGIAIGALGFGYLADRIGRRRLFVATLLLYSVAAIATSRSWNYESFVVFRFITALGVGGEYSAVASAISEFVPGRHRGRTNALVMNFWALGGILAGLVTIIVLGTLGGESWRYAMLFGAVSAVYALFARRHIPESPRWLASQGKLREADAVITEITGLEGEDVSAELERPRASFREQLGELRRDYRGRLAFGMALDFSEAFGYYGLYTAVAVFVLTDGVVEISAGAVGWFYVIGNVGALAGGFAVAIALDRIGRKPSVPIAYTGAALSMFLIPAAAGTGSAALTLGAFVIGAFWATCGWVSAYPTFSEIFPTHLRATGIGASVGFGRIGAIVGQIVLAETAVVFGLWSVFTLLAAAWMIGAIAGVIWWIHGIEGRGMSLEQLGRPRGATGGAIPQSPVPQSP